MNFLSSFFSLIHSSANDQPKPQDVGKAHARHWHQSCLQLLLNLIKKVKAVFTRCFYQQPSSSFNPRQSFRAATSSRSSEQIRQMGKRVKQVNTLPTNTTTQLGKLDLYQLSESQFGSYLRDLKVDNLQESDIKAIALKLQEIKIGELPETNRGDYILFFEQIKPLFLRTEILWQLFELESNSPETKLRLSFLPQSQTLNLIQKLGTDCLYSCSDSQFEYYFCHLEIDTLTEKAFLDIASRLQTLEITSLNPSDQKKYVSFFQKAQEQNFFFQGSPLYNFLFVPETLNYKGDEKAFRLNLLKDEWFLAFLDQDYIFTALPQEKLKKKGDALIQSLEFSKVTVNQFAALFVWPSLSIKKERFAEISDENKQMLKEKWGEQLFEFIEKTITIGIADELSTLIAKIKAKDLNLDCYLDWNEFWEDYRRCFLYFSHEQLIEMIKKFGSESLRQIELSKQQEKTFYNALTTEEIQSPQLYKLFFKPRNYSAQTIKEHAELMSRLTDSQFLEFLDSEHSKDYAKVNSENLEKKIADLISLLDLTTLTDNQLQALFIHPSSPIKNERFALLTAKNKQLLKNTYPGQTWESEVQETKEKKSKAEAEVTPKNNFKTYSIPSASPKLFYPTLSSNFDLYPNWESFIKTFGKEEFANFTSEEVEQVIKKYNFKPLQDKWLSETQEKEYFTNLETNLLKLEEWSLLFPTYYYDLPDNRDLKRFAFFSNEQTQPFLSNEKIGNYWIKMFSDSQFLHYSQQLLSFSLSKENLNSIAERLRKVEICKLAPNQQEHFKKLFQTLNNYEFSILRTLFTIDSLTQAESSLRLNFLTDSQLFDLLDTHAGNTVVNGVATNSTRLHQRLLDLIKTLKPEDVTFQQFLNLFVYPKLSMKVERSLYLSENVKRTIQDRYGERIITMMTKEIVGYEILWIHGIQEKESEENYKARVRELNVRGDES